MLPLSDVYYHMVYAASRRMPSAFDRFVGPSDRVIGAFVIGMFIVTDRKLSTFHRMLGSVHWLFGPLTGDPRASDCSFWVFLGDPLPPHSILDA